NRFEQNNNLNNNGYYDNKDNYNNYNNQEYFNEQGNYDRAEEFTEDINGNKPVNKGINKKLITKIVFAVNLVAFTACAIYLGNYYYNSNKVKGKQNDLSNLIDQTVTTEEGQEDRYISIRDKYPNLVGRLRFHNYNDIIDLPVMQTKDDPMYYLYRDQDGEDSKWGTPFLDYRCDLKKPTANFMIYAHNMKDLTQFGSLKNYKNKSYWNKYPTIEFESMYEERMEYEVIASFYAQIYPSTKTDVFKYYKFFDALVPEEFDDFVDNIIKIANYKTGVTASFGDQLITLSTCDYSKHVDDGRFVVVAKKSSEKSENSDSLDDFVDVIESTPKPVPTVEPTKEPTKTPKPTKAPTKEPVATKEPEPVAEPTPEPQPTENVPPPEDFVPTEEPGGQEPEPDVQPTEEPGDNRPWWEIYY
ncbi:MAG: sortase, partial [Lachnospiraceae bacterium]|nr:sortase [Lachnospiraceae bacterium]